MRTRMLMTVLSGCMLLSMRIMAQQGAGESSATVERQATLLTAEETAKILPATVFFRGLSAPVQARNAGGLRFRDKRVMLVALVDTSGYSSQVQEKYQAYLITETALTIEGHRLEPGAYGCGFIAGDTFIVQDIGAHDLFTVHSTRDAALKRPTPLQVLAAPGEPGAYRLYAGRNAVTFRVAGGQ